MCWKIRVSTFTIIGLLFACIPAQPVATASPHTRPQIHPMICLVHSGIDAETLALAGLSGEFLHQFVQRCNDTPELISPYAEAIDRIRSAEDRAKSIERGISIRGADDDARVRLSQAQDLLDRAHASFSSERDSLFDTVVDIASDHLSTEGLEDLEVVLSNIDRKVPRVYCILSLSDAEWGRLERIAASDPALDTAVLEDSDRLFVSQLRSRDTFLRARRAIESHTSDAQNDIASSFLIQTP